MRPNIFQKAMDEDDDSHPSSRPAPKSHINYLLQRLEHQNQQKMVQDTTKILLSNPDNNDIFGYDSYFDSIQQRKQEVQANKQKEKGKTRYIDALMEASEKRKRERSIVYEKMAENELKKDKNEADKPERYITESYKQVLEANKAFLREDEAKEIYNKENSVNNKTDLNAIYRTIYKEGMFAGGDRIDMNKPNPQKTAKKIEINFKSNTNNENKVNNESNNTLNVKNNEKNNEEIKQIAKSRSRSRSKEHKNDKIYKKLEENNKKPEENSKTVSNEIEKKPEETEEKPQIIEKTDKILSARERYLERKKATNI